MAEPSANCFRLVPAWGTEDLKSSIFEPLRGWSTIKCDQCAFAFCAPSIWAGCIGVITPIEPHLLSTVDGMSNVRTDETYALFSMNGAVRLLHLKPPNAMPLSRQSKKVY